MSIRAPELRGRGWLNTGGVALNLAALRGKFVLLDFWTFACVNCLHVIEELRPVQERFADILVTVGVHSPKFPHEGEPQAVLDAVDRYRVEHPVLDDADLLTWDSYAAKAWPTLVLIDPRGYIVTQLAGERHAGELAGLIERLSVLPEAAGTLRRGAGPYVPGEVGGGGFAVGELAGGLRFPGGLLVLPAERYAGGGVLVSDTAHQQLVILASDLTTELARIGTGERRPADDGLSRDALPDTRLLDDDVSAGGAGPVTFADPLGAALLPAALAEQVGYDVLIADSAGHALRALCLTDLTVRTVARDLSTPWDVAWFDGTVVIAMAGVHQLWAFDPASGAVRVLAGTGREGLVDGVADRSWFAQPSGLAVAADGRTLWVVDAEASAVRRLWFADDGSLQVTTVIGHGLFEFGSQDGTGDQARLQHPLGVAVLPDGAIAIADTYNGAVRRYDPATDHVSTLLSGLAEPAALVVIPVQPAAPSTAPAISVLPDQPAAPPEPAGAELPVAELLVAELLVAESAAHRLALVPISAAVATTRTGPAVIRRPVVDLAPGAVELSITFRPPPGQKLDASLGDPTWLEVSAVPPEVLPAGAGADVGLHRFLTLADRVSGGRVEGTLQIAVRASACDEGDGLGAACYLYRQQWEIPFRLVPGSTAHLALELTPAPA